MSERDEFPEEEKSELEEFSRVKRGNFGWRKDLEDFEGERAGEGESEEEKGELNPEITEGSDKSETIQEEWIVPEELPERIRAFVSSEEVPELAKSTESPAETELIDAEADVLEMPKLIESKGTEEIEEPVETETPANIEKLRVGSKLSEKLERDILLERLERKLAEKEKEVEELRRMLNEGNLEEKIEEIKTEIKNELLNEILIELKKDLVDLNKVKDLEAKVVELSKTVQSLMSELLYLKAELRTEVKKPESEKPVEEPAVEEEEEIKEELIEEEEDIIVCD